MFNTILCPIDFSTHSRQALRYAALLAARRGGRLIVLFVEDPFLINSAVAANYNARELMGSLQDELSRIVRRTIAPYRIPDNRLTLQVTVGKPHLKIRAAAERAGCDLIVMGSHGATGPGRLMFGSTTHRALRQIDVPILAIPPVKAGTPRPSAAWPGRWALAPVDLDAKDSRHALNAALVADALGTQLLLLHVVEPPQASLLRGLKLPAPKQPQAAVTRAEAKLDALRERAQAVVVTAGRVVTGKAAEQITAAASDRQIGLVIMARRRGRGFFGARQGAISYQVVSTANTPVLALPGDDAWIRSAPKARKVTPR